LIVLATWAFSIWAQNFSSYNRVYGSIGALLIVMLLIFVNSLMLLIGYELNVSINYLKSKKKDTQPGEIINNPQLVKSKRK
jgi:membrane protein